MNFLPIILLIFYMLKGGSGLKDLFSNLDLNSIAPLLTTFGVDEKLVSTLFSGEFKSLLSGKFDLATLLPLITSLAGNFNANTPAATIAKAERLDPIKDVAPSQIYSTLGNYFSN